jgi:hypothetical protein
MNNTLTKEKNLLDSMYKMEIIAGIAGGVIVFLIVVVYYFWNGLMFKKVKKSIN